MSPREPSKEENRVRTWQERYGVFILDAYIATVERSADTEILQQRRGQQSVKKLIIRPVVSIVSGVKGARLSTAEETTLYGTKDEIESIEYDNTATHLCKLSTAERESPNQSHCQWHQLVEGPTHRYPTSEEIVTACRPPVFVWQLGVHLHLRVSEPQ
jgi:hypothetical protein